MQVFTTIELAEMPGFARVLVQSMMLKKVTDVVFSLLLDLTLLAIIPKTIRI